MVHLQTIESEAQAKFDKLSDEEKSEIKAKQVEAVTAWANRRIIRIETATQNAANSRLLFK